MITKEKFAKFINLVKEYEEFVHKAEDLGLLNFESPLCEFSYKMMDILIADWFTEAGAQWVYWWLYEKTPNKTDAWDENGEAIPTETIDDIWNIVEKEINTIQEK